MAGSTIEAKLRIAAEVAQAITALKQLRKEVLDTGDAARQASGGGATSKSAVADSARDRISAEREVASETKKVAAEAANAVKAAAAEKTKAERQAAREASQLAAAERKRLRAEETETKRAQRERDDAEKKASRFTAYRRAQLAPQLTDIAVGLSTGQSPVTVALQQGGQLRDLYGSFGGVLKALRDVITPTRLALGALGATAGLFVYNVVQGWRETDQLTKSLALSGNAANFSAGQMDAIAVGMSRAGLSSRGFAREMATALLSVRGQTDTTLAATVRAGAAIARLSGQSADEVTKIFESQAEGITAWAVKANQAYSFLTPAQVAHVRRLESEGRTAEATKYANEELAKTLETRSVRALGSLERAWEAAKRKVSEYIDAIKSIGREETPEEKLLAIEKERAEIAARNALRARGLGTGGRRRSTDDARDAELESQQNQINRDLLRGAEAAAAERASQEEIKRQSKAHQDSLADIALAGAQRRLAQQRAVLDREQDQVERADAQGLLSATDKAVALNDIERRRLQAQEALVKRQIEIEAGRVEEKPEDKRAKEARVTGLEAQLLEVQSRIKAAAAAGRSTVEGDLLQKSREAAQAWAEVWQRAADKIRQLVQENAVNDANQIADPAARAAAAASAAIAAAQHELTELRRDLNLRIAVNKEPGQVVKLVEQLRRLNEEAPKALGEQGRRALFESLSTQFAALTEALQIQDEAIAQQVERGTVTVEEGERRKFAARAQALPQLRQMLELLRATAATEAERNAIDRLINQLTELGNKTTEVERTLNGALATGFKQLFEDIATGSETALQSVKKFLVGVLKSMLNVINQRLGEQLANSLIAKDGGGGGYLQIFAKYLATLFHTGGVVGRSAGGMARAVSPLVFAGAQVLHAGGIAAPAGLRSNERAAILEVGEEVLTEDNPRHINNYRSGGLSVQSSYTFNGSGGTERDQRQAAAELDQRMRAVVEQWAGENMRQGGRLSGGRRG